MSLDLGLPLKPMYTQVSGWNNKTFDEGSGSGSGGDEENMSLLTVWSLACTVGFTLAIHFWEGHLDARQKKAYQQTAFPKELETTVSYIDEQEGKEELSAAAASEKFDRGAKILPQLRSKFLRSQAYGLDKINFSMFASAFDTTVSVILLLFGFLPMSWDASVTIAAYMGMNQIDCEISISLIFLGLVTVVGTITSLPFEMYSTFQIEKKHGFNKQTPALFITDKIKSLALTFGIGGPFIALLLKIIKWGGEYFYLYVWGFMFVFSVFMMTIVPIVIMPLFNKYEPLPDGDLKDKIFKVAGSLDFPLAKLFVMDGSKRSSHSNAFMFGWFNNKRIVLFDTLLEQVHDDEILAILGHELGHWKMGHTKVNFVVTQLYFGAAFYFFGRCYGASDLYSAFGFNDTSKQIPTIIALLLFFQTLWAPVDKLLSFILTYVSRVNEFQADEFSAVKLNLSQELQRGLCKIHLENLGAMCPDPWYSSYHYSHPPLVERLSAMMKFNKQTTTAAETDTKKDN